MSASARTSLSAADGGVVHRASSASPVRFPLITTLRHAPLHVSSSAVKEYVLLSSCTLLVVHVLLVDCVESLTPLSVHI